MASASILILSSGPLCRNPRVLKEATALGAHGFDVTVMTLAGLPRYEAYDRELMTSAPFRKIALDHMSATGVRGMVGRTNRLATWLARKAIRFGVESGRALGPVASFSRMARRFRADLTIVHTELPMLVGRGLLAQGRRVAADFEDWHTRDLLPSAQATRPLKLLRALEGDLMRRAVYTSTTSASLADALQAAYGAPRPVVITNSFPLQPQPARAPLRGPPALFWFSQTIGAGRGLESFIAAWGRTQQPSRLCLLGDVDPEYRSSLVRPLSGRHRDALEFLPLTSPQELPAVIARHDLGLALEASNPSSRDLTITNKILQYLNAGLAVLASDTSGQREVLHQAPDAGRLLPSVGTDELARWLDVLLADPGRIATMGREARRAAERIYCWEREVPRLVAAVEAALTLPPGVAR
ncbi:MAG TPA: glycosyltransferase [Opitutaceae bacterium]|nr:glycosyltransferase [Opitutaceae bacterium]